MESVAMYVLLGWGTGAMSMLALPLLRVVAALQCHSGDRKSVV